MNMALMVTSDPVDVGHEDGDEIFCLDRQQGGRCNRVDNTCNRVAAVTGWTIHVTGWPL